MKKTLLVLAAFLLVAPSLKSEIVLAENGASDYQVVIPDSGAEGMVDRWMLLTGKLVETAFRKNGFQVSVVREAEKDSDKPGIYLGATAFARANGVKLDHEDWSYQIKTVGRDLIIAGADREDPLKKKIGSVVLCQLGTVKGVCDFLRQYAGVRFLFMNTVQSHYGTRGDGMAMLNEDGTLKVDTRSIGFLPVKKIALPDSVDIRKTPMLRACADRNYETFYYIANNFFPLLSNVQGGGVKWHDAISRSKYGESHPEYFALKPDGKRSVETMAERTDFEEEQCATHPDVIRLMIEEVLKKVDEGAKTIIIPPQDSYRLCYCNCEGCVELFNGIRADNWSDVTRRGRTGRLWQTYFAVAAGLYEKHPEARLVVWDYQDTPANTIKEFPPNVIPKLNMGSRSDFDRFEGANIPAGVCVLEETFTGFGVAGRYLPERTPEYIADMVQAMAKYKVQWTTRDGSMGNARGLQAPAYYVYGRMLDDPEADWKNILDEFCEAAFGNVAGTMKQFFNGIHTQMALYSDFFGINGPAWKAKYGRSRLRGNKWHVKSMYPPEYCIGADNLLRSAERLANNDDIKARLHLIRIEFDYLSGLSRMFNLHDAWLLCPEPAFLQPLLETIETWHAQVREAAGNPLDDWPQMHPYNSHDYYHASLRPNFYQQNWNATCVSWDTEPIRSGILEDARQMKVPSVAAQPAIDDDAWEQATEQVLRPYDSMPVTTTRSSFKVLRDSGNLYVRFDCLYPAGHPEDFKVALEEKDVLKYDFVEVGIKGAEGEIFRFAGNPLENLRYDSVSTTDEKGGAAEDIKWTGDWSFEYKVSGKKSLYGLQSRVWTGLLKIPFATLGAETAPPAGTKIEFNAGRTRVNPRIVPVRMRWRNSATVNNAQVMGVLEL